MKTILFLLAASLPVFAQVSKEEIRRLLDAHVSEQTIVSYVQRNGPMEPLSVEDLGDLKTAGASDDLLLSLLKAQGTSSSGGTPSMSPTYSTPPDSSTVYDAPQYNYNYYSSSPDYSTYPYYSYPYPYYYPYYSVYFSYPYARHFSNHSHFVHAHPQVPATVTHPGAVTPGVSRFRQPTFQPSMATPSTMMRPQSVVPRTVVPQTVAPHTSTGTRGGSVPRGGGGVPHR